MTERGEAALTASRHHLQIGPSALRWKGGALVVDFDEMSVPRPPRDWLPRRLRGQVRIEADAMPGRAFDLDPAGRHVWAPLAPLARVSVEVAGRGGFEGHGYLDSNWGDEPLEAGFARWDWARARTPDGRALVAYDARRRDGGETLMGLAFDAGGGVEAVPLPTREPMRRGFWGVRRDMRGQGARVVRTLEDGPFYTRSEVETRHEGAPLRWVHETFDGDRFASRTVKAMLPFRMPRRARWKP